MIGGQSALQGGFSPEHHAEALEERQQRLSEIAWTLRERGYDGSICAMIENEGRALSRIAGGVRGEGPLVETGKAMTALPPPAVAPAPVAIAPASAPPPRSTPDRRLASLAEIDGLPPREKAALFA